MILADTTLIPQVDPLGIPGPSGVFVFLYLLTLLLHLLFMNLVLGGHVLALGLNVAAIAGRPRVGAIANVIYQATPAALSMTITMGVAPLLFVQVLYGPVFYTANVLLGFAWFSLVIVLLVGFYLSYWLTLRGSNAMQKRAGVWDDKPGRRLAVGVLTTACFVWIAWVLTNNHELSLHPDKWATGETWGSPRWYAGTATTIPRFLHNIVGATAIGGLWLAAIGWWRRRRHTGDEGTNTAMIRIGLIAAAAVTAVQIAVGLFFLFSLDTPVLQQLMGFRTALGTVWTISLVFALLLPMLCVYAMMNIDRFLWFALTVVDALLVLVGMLLGHEQVRVSTLALAQPESFSIEQWTVYPQWTIMTIFAVLLVIVLGVVGLMLRWMIVPGGMPAAETETETETEL